MKSPNITANPIIFAGDVNCITIAPAINIAPDIPTINTKSLAAFFISCDFFART